MSTTPTTSDTKEYTHYTIVSGSNKGNSSFEGVSLILLNRGGKPFKSEFLSKLSELNLQEIISVETSEHIFEMENMTKKLSRLKFLLVSKDISVGERINIAVKEAAGTHALVFWNDMNLQIKTQAERILKQAVQGDFLCRVPILMNDRKETIPTRFAPGYSRKKLEVYSLAAVKNKIPTLYPYDYCAIYHRQSFILTGGYDPLIMNPYWQKLDFGFRAYLWGEKIETSTALRINYIGDIPREDTTRDYYYRRFFLKNMAPKFSGDCSTLPFSHFLSFVLQSGSSMYQAFKEYKQIKKWVEENSLRFKTDPFNLTELWKME
ncbi:MAG: hypothetical protein B6241_06625 [Spirochaetaceae bacterium 4572_59]|nr:MAG: hypothetical protein B6241_06625 [Spirochaetaceae bacterium 4572_59]